MNENVITFIILRAKRHWILMHFKQYFGEFSRRREYKTKPKIQNLHAIRAYKLKRNCVIYFLSHDNSPQAIFGAKFFAHKPPFPSSRRLQCGHHRTSCTLLGVIVALYRIHENIVLQTFKHFQILYASWYYNMMMRYECCPSLGVV